MKRIRSQPLIVSLSPALLAWLLVCLAAVLAATQAGAQAVNYSGKSRVLNVGKLIIASGTYTSPQLAGIPEDTAPYVFYLMDLRQDLKPRGWVLQNPLAPPNVTAAIRQRWTTIEPPLTPNGVLHAARYTVGSPVTKDMAAYWEVDLQQTSIQDLLKYDLLFISSHTIGEDFTPQEQEKLRKLVEAGGVVWVDDCWKLRISDAGRFFLPDLQFHGSTIGKANPTSYAAVADRNHPLITTPYFLSQNELNHLGDKNVGGYYHTGFVPPGTISPTPPFTDTTPAVPPNHSQPQADVLAPVIFNSWTQGLPGGPYPYVSAGRYGAGYVIVTSGDVGDAINANCTGSTGYNIPAPDYDKNGGSVCGDATYSSDPEDLKFAYNCLDWASSFSTYRRGPEHSGYVPESATLPLARQWRFPLAAGEGVETDPIILRGRIFATTARGGNNGGRLLAILQDPTQVPGAAGPIPLWSFDFQNYAPSSITTAEVGFPANLNSGTPARSKELLLISSGGQVAAIDSAYSGPGGTAPPWPSPSAGNGGLVWVFGPEQDPNGNVDVINGAPVYMDGMIFVTTQSGAVYEIDPQTGKPAYRSVVMPHDSSSQNATLGYDPNNPTDQLPLFEPALHYQNTKWNYMAATPAAGYVVDRGTEPDDPTMVLGVYATATQLPASANTAPHGGLLQFPIKVANEHYQLGEGSELPPWPNAPTNQSGQPQGPWLVHTLDYFAIKNPELATASIVNNQIVAVPVANSGAGTIRVTIQWPDKPNQLVPSYYDTQNGAMAGDFGAGATTVIPNDQWVFFKAAQPLKWTNGANNYSRGLYNQIVLSPVQWRYAPNGQLFEDVLTEDCVVHVDYDVDEADPLGPLAGGSSAGPGFHPEVAFLDFPPSSSSITGFTPPAAGSAILDPPVIGLDDSIYFGGENSVLYSVSHSGARGLPVNWKYYANLDSSRGYTGWVNSAGQPLNPVTLAVNNQFTKDIHYEPPVQDVIRAAPTVGNNQLFVTVTDLASGTSHIVGLNPLEFQITVPPPAQTNTKVAQAQGGVPVSFFLNSDPNNAAVASRDPAQPVGMIAQYDPVTDSMRQFFPQSDDFSVDMATLKVTLNRFGSMYSNLPIYVWYNLANGQAHSFMTNPPSPPDEVHNLLPGLNVAPDPNGQYFIGRPAGPIADGTTTYSSGGAHPTFFYPGDQISNVNWRFPDPIWNPGVTLTAPPMATTVFSGTSISSPPNAAIADASPLLIGDTVFVGASQLTTANNPGAPLTGLMALAADPRGGLQSYTADNVGIFDFQVVKPTPGANVPPALAAAINNPGNVVGNALNVQAAMNPRGTLLAPYPPEVSYLDVQDFKVGAQPVGMISSPPVTTSGGVVGTGVRGGNVPGAITMLGSPLTVALDSYRLAGLDAGGNIVFEIPSTTKTTLLGADEPIEETEAGTSAGVYATSVVAFNRASSMQRVTASNVLISDTGNDRVVQCDLGGNVISEMTRYYDPAATYQPADLYQVAPPNPPVQAAFAVGNKHLTGPTDAFQWTDNYNSGNALVQETYNLIVDGGNSQIVLLVDKQFLTGPLAGQFVPIGTAPGPDGLDAPPVADPNNNPIRWYHVKAWGTQPSPTGVQYHYRNVYPYLVPWFDALGTHFRMPVVIATIDNIALAAKPGPVPAGTYPWAENGGSTLAVLYGSQFTAGGLIPRADQGMVMAAATALADPLAVDANGLLIHRVQHPVFARLYFGGPAGAAPLVHLLYIDQGARYTANVNPANGAVNPQDTRVGNWGAYDLLFPGPTGPTTPDQLTPGANFVPQVVGSLDDVDYARLTASPDIYYALTNPPPGMAAAAPNSFQPTSLEFMPMTSDVLITNGALNQLANPTLPIGAPDRLLGPGGEVLLVDAAPFFRAAPYQPDSSASPSIQFRSIPVQGSYLLQQVMSADRSFSGG